MKHPKKIQLPAVDLRATVDAASIDEEARTVEATFYSGAEVIRQPMFDEPFLLSFSMEPGAANLTRFNAGAAVVDSHSEYSLSDVLGKTSDARLENGVYRTKLHFSQRADRDGIWKDVRDGITPNTSMRARILELRELGEDKDTGLQRFQASRWEPLHVALVATPADPGAQINLSDESSTVECSVHYRAPAPAVAQHGDKTMDKIKVRLLADCEAGTKGEIIEIEKGDFDLHLHTTEIAVPKTPEQKAEPKDPEDLAAEDVIEAKLAADKKHLEAKRRIAAHYGLDELWAQRQHNLGVSDEDSIASASAERAKQTPSGPNTIGFGEDFDSAEYKCESMAQAVAARATGKEPEERARNYHSFSFAELALESLALRGKGRSLDVRRDVDRIISADMALHSTSDFPLLLSNALNKMLLPEYQAATPTYRQLAEQKTFNDFRAHNFLRSGDFPNLLKVNEHGEFKYGTVGENNEPVTAATYGRVVGLSRQTLVNDDLGAFATLATKAGRRVADFENALFFSTCITAGSGMGPNLSDGNAVYDSASHANETGAGAISNALLEEAFALMMAQTSIDGLKLNVMPAMVLVSPTSYGAARRLLADVNATQASEVNTFAGQIRVVSDANLTGTRFYVLANPSELANYVYGYLGGQGPRTESRAGFEVDGVEFKVALDFGVGAIEYRAGVTGAGA